MTGCEVLTKPHPVYAQFRGKTGYGIRRIAVISPRLHAVVDKCDVAAKSADARDRHFLSSLAGMRTEGRPGGRSVVDFDLQRRYVGNFDPCPSKALRAEVPALESAITSLASASSKLADKFPGLGAH